MWIVTRKNMQLGIPKFKDAYRLAVMLKAGLKYQYNAKYSQN